MTEQKILAIDAGSTESGYAIMSFAPEFKLHFFGKIDNIKLLDIVKSGEYDVMVYEEFASYGMPIGDTTIKSITWNGRYIQSVLDRGIDVTPILRKDEKMILCGTMLAKDKNIRAALINRYAQFDFQNGRGTKKNPDIFYGVHNDAWAAIAVGVAYSERDKYTAQTKQQ